MKILFRADSSSTIGTGHIMRDLVLASKYAQKGDRVIFATQDLKGNINHKIVEAGYEIELLNSNDKKELVKCIKKLHIDLLVIDSYKIGYKQEKYIKEKTGIKIFVFDDTYEKHFCDTLLNHNIGADKKRYKKLLPQGARLLCGIKQTLIREEFKKVTKKKRSIKNKKSIRVFLSIGGTDNHNLNIKILKILEQFKNIKTTLVTTSANIYLASLQEYAKERKDVSLYVNTNKIAKLMNRSDFAIITPSVTVNEIIYLKIPFIAIRTISNQNEIYKYIKKDFLALDKKKLETLGDKIKIIINKYDYYTYQYKRGKYIGSK